jgi:hypothetical protein
MPDPELKEIERILEAVRPLAVRYYKLTGKPLGVAGEMAEFEAAKHLRLQLCSARQDGYDAERLRGHGPRFVQIKGRAIMEKSKPGQQVGRINLNKEWDSVVLVVLDDHYRATEIFEAERPAIETALKAPGSKARNERGALSISKFKSIGQLAWSPK